MQKIKKLFQHQNNSLISNLKVTLFETIVTKGINFINILLLTRILGPEDYGKYSLLFVSMVFCSSIFDFGMENTAVRFSIKDKHLRNSVFGLYFLTKAVILSIITILLAFWGHNIFTALGKQAIACYLPFLIAGLIGESLFFVNDTYLQSIQHFKLRAVINIARAVISFAYIFLLMLNKVLVLKYVFFVYFLPLLFSVIFSLRYITFVKSYFCHKLPKQLINEIIHYEKWMFNLSIANNVLSRIDFFMLSLWVSYSQLGIYNAAFQLSSIVSFLPFILGKVMLPKLADLEPKATFDCVNGSIKHLLPICLLIICLIPFSCIVVPSLLGTEYQKSVFILQLLLLAFVVSLVSVPFEQALYSIGEPKLIAMAKYLQIAVIVILNTFTVPKFGINWAAINVIVTRILTAVVLILLYKKQEKLFFAPEINTQEVISVYD